MNLEVDQSGRIEETQRDTIIAIANKTNHFTIKIPARVKRSLELIYRKKGKPKIFLIHTFATGIALAIKKSKFKLGNLRIDIEYPGHEKLIAQIIRQSLNKDFNITFKQIGKNSAAHYWAYFTYKKKFKVDVVLSLKELKGFLKN